MAIERSAKTREQNRLSMWIAALIVGALIMVVLVTCGSLYRRLHSNKERIEELRSEIAKEEQRAEEIEEYKQYTKSRVSPVGGGFLWLGEVDWGCGGSGSVF